MRDDCRIKTREEVAVGPREPRRKEKGRWASGLRNLAEVVALVLYLAFMAFLFLLFLGYDAPINRLIRDLYELIAG